MKQIADNPNSIHCLTTQGKDKIKSLLELINSIVLLALDDKVNWKWSLTNKFLMRNFYQFLSHGGIKC